MYKTILQLLRDVPNKNGMTVLDSIDRHACIVIDKDSQIVFVNNHVKTLLGYTILELMGRSLTVIMPESHREYHLKGVKKYLESGQKTIPWTSALMPALKKDGTQINVEINFAELNYGDDKMFVGILR